jgi:hypothetical protein
MASGRLSRVKGKVLDIPTVPTVGTATAGELSATVAFTASTKGGPVSTYTALSNPGSVTGSGTSSPVTVTGLTAGTAYTFTVRGNNVTGSSEYSSASNSVTPTEILTSYESIATVTVGSGGTSSYVEFTSIPSTFTHLQVRMLYGTSSAGSTSIMRLNADTSSVYAYHYLAANGSTAFTGASINRNLAHLTDFNGGSITASPAAGVIDILDYANGNKFKTLRTLSGYDANGSGVINFESNLWRSTSTVSSIQIYAPSGGSIVEYSKFALYGIKGV